MLPWRPVLLSWLVARALVLAALAGSQAVEAERRDDLLGWDADWYRRIADVGYDGVEEQGLRFFPLLPLIARALALGGDPGPALLVVANLAAVGAALVAHRLALDVGLGRAAADRAVWVLALAPASYVLVMGYTESLFLLLLGGLLLAARRQRWLLVALLGLLAGALRPTGVVVGLPVLLEALRGRDRLAARAAAVVAPAVGLASYLVWVGREHGDALLPFTVQQRENLRGGTFVNPLPSVLDALREPAAEWGSGPLLHVPGVLAAVALLVVAARRMPVSHTAYAAVTLLLALTARDLSSFDRYALSALPLVLAAGTLRRVPLLLVPSAALMVTSAVLAFVHGTTP